MRMRKARVGRKPLTPAVTRSVLSFADPVLAAVVNEGLFNHINKGTASSYATGAKDYIAFCKKRGIEPWPVDDIVYCGWLHVTAGRGILMTSVGVYMAGVRDASIIEGHDWRMTGNEALRRTMRFLRKKHPVDVKGRKVPITVGVVRAILALLPGWPNMAKMSEEDRVFAAATVIGVSGFLRGGEFLASAKSERAVLATGDIVVRRIGGLMALVVAVRQPKTKWWLKSVAVPCFENTSDDDLCPVRLWHEYLARRGPNKTSGPAFVLKGKPLSRNFMVAKTTKLMFLANISFVDNNGVRMDVHAASWRSGAVCSAVKAGVAVPHIMAFGRWTSEAWMNYLLQAPPDLQESARSMWADTNLRLDHPTSSILGVVEFDVGGLFAPFLSQPLNAALSKMSIDVNNPPNE
jgi:hypothetical protein